ncbi:hypothetical protein [Alicyclobacillus contaminans]|uniref:hypothetical protein n=1 Tax=Alicyclobacillus contaminans TaxID=392016 RepID=UPI0004288A4F|nr:hypothetical protein [Alicyclobacillus contaminans]
MKEKDKGSTLLTVLAAVLILSTMMTALVATSAQDMANSAKFMDATTALDNARSGMQALYQKTGEEWEKMGGETITDVATAIADLQQLPEAVSADFPNSDSSRPFTLVKFNLADDDFQQVQANDSSATTIWATYDVVVSSTVNQVTRTLSDTFTISGSFTSGSSSPGGGGDNGGDNSGNGPSMTVYADDHLYVLGNPKISQGQIEAGAVDFRITPWSYFLGLSSNQTFLPDFTGSTLSAAKGYYSFSGFNGDDWLTSCLNKSDDSSPTQINASSPPPSIAVSQLPQYEHGAQLVPYQSYSQWQTDIKQLSTTLKNVSSSFANNPPAFGIDLWSGILSPWFGGDSKYVAQGDLNSNHTYLVIQSATVNNQTHVPGNLVVSGFLFGQTNLNMSSSMLVDGSLFIPHLGTMTVSQPLFVKGDLYVLGGTLTGTAPIYVGGHVVIVNTPGTTSQLDLRSAGPIIVIGVPTATINGRLVSGDYVYLEGSPGSHGETYTVHGQVEGENVILTSIPDLWGNPGIIINGNNAGNNSGSGSDSGGKGSGGGGATTPAVSGLMLAPMPQPTTSVGS